jgi:thioredoxin reductase (NADPH)
MVKNTTQAKNEITKGITFIPRVSRSHTPNPSITYDLLVVGAGVAGYAGAMYASRLGLKVLLLGEQPGGTLALTGRVENYPGFISIDGQKLTELLENHAMDYEVDMDIEIVDSILRDKKMNLFKAVAGDNSYLSRAVLFATGAKVKKLGVEGEDEFFGKGVGYCALCEAAFIKGKVVAVAGGGDSAVKEAILVSEYAKKVYIINNEQELHPEGHNQKILDEKARKGIIEVINSNEIVMIAGKDNVEKLILKKPYDSKQDLRVDALFVYIGHVPRSSLAKRVGVKLNRYQEIMINTHSETNVPGFFAAGDVTSIEWKQAITGVSQAVTAAYYAYNYIHQLE